jgi:hypothetical protein
MAAQVTEAQLPTSEATREQCDRDEAEQMAEACSSKALMGPNVQGNRPADEMRTEDQSTRRRVRLTVGLAVDIGHASGSLEGLGLSERALDLPSLEIFRL